MPSPKPARQVPRLAVVAGLLFALALIIRWTAPHDRPVGPIGAGNREGLAAATSATATVAPPSAPTLSPAEDPPPAPVPYGVDAVPAPAVDSGPSGASPHPAPTGATSPIKPWILPVGSARPPAAAHASATGPSPAVPDDISRNPYR
jgi:hypothetical protein